MQEVSQVQKYPLWLRISKSENSLDHIHTTSKSPSHIANIQLCFLSSLSGTCTWELPWVSAQSSVCPAVRRRSGALPLLLVCGRWCESVIVGSLFRKAAEAYLTAAWRQLNHGHWAVGSKNKQAGGQAHVSLRKEWSTKSENTQLSKQTFLQWGEKVHTHTRLFFIPFVSR